MFVHVQKHPSGLRCYIAGQRVHHGVTGLALVAAAAAVRRPTLAAAALVIVAHDLHDWKVWFKREVLDRTVVSAVKSLT